MTRRVSLRIGLPESADRSLGQIRAPDGTRIYVSDPEAGPTGNRAVVYRTRERPGGLFPADPVYVEWSAADGRRGRLYFRFPRVARAFARQVRDGTADILRSSPSA